MVFFFRASVGLASLVGSVLGNLRLREFGDLTPMLWRGLGLSGLPCYGGQLGGRAVAGEVPRVLMILRSLAFRLSMALVV